LAWVTPGRARLAIVALTLIAWGGVPWGVFQFDDFQNVVRDAATTDPAALAERLLHGLRPLTRLSYFFDAHLFGMQAAGFLTMNLALHIVCTLFVFELARGRIGDTAALCAALCFSLQPANAEVVAYVSGRSTGLMTALLLAGLLLYDRGRPYGALGCFALACLAKEVALVFPLLLLTWDGAQSTPRSDASRSAVRAIVLAAATAALLFGLDHYRSLLGASLQMRPMLDNLLANGRAVPQMLSLWFRPWALSVDHDFAERGDLSASVGGLLALASLFVAAFAGRRRYPLLALAICWPLVALLPTNSIFPKLDFVTERQLYPAWIGPSIALGAGLHALLSFAATPKVRHWGSTVAAAVLLFAATGSCMWRASLWRDPTQLWSDATQKAPNKSRCWNNLGMAELIAGRDADALTSFRRAVRLDPANEIAAGNLRTAALLCGPACADAE
jgi:hypothetical protein